METDTMANGAAAEDQLGIDALEAGHSRATRLANEVMQRIISLELAPGSTITEGDLAEQADVSKPTAREALQWVMVRRLLTPRRGSGYTVEPITLRDARDLMVWWGMTAADAMALAATIAHVDDQLADLRNVIDEPRDPDSGQQLTESGRDLVASHFCGNRSVMVAMNWQWPQVARLENLVQRERQIRCSPNAGEVLDAVLAGDPTEARARMERRARDYQAQALDTLLSMSAVQDANLTVASSG